MSWALEVLELDASADERAIKRAYARLLRSNRPDDDAAAFQRLHEAYQTALHWQRHQQALATTDAEA
ncbi:heat-shock protein, partial [Stenotrophomonas sp. MH1]